MHGVLLAGAACKHHTAWRSIARIHAPCRHAHAAPLQDLQALGLQAQCVQVSNDGSSTSSAPSLDALRLLFYDTMSFRVGIGMPRAPFPACMRWRSMHRWQPATWLQARLLMQCAATGSMGKLQASQLMIELSPRVPACADLGCLQTFQGRGGTARSLR
jgi:hypothetical protein